MTVNLDKFLESGMPWWVGLIVIVIVVIATAFLTFLGTRLSSKDKVQTTLVEQTVARQKTLDERQLKMMDDFQEEIARLKDEILLVRKELNQERDRNGTLERKMQELQEENRLLKGENTELKSQVEALKKELKELQKPKEGRNDANELPSRATASSN
jgi:chromosome segregation ATPase